MGDTPTRSKTAGAHKGRCDIPLREGAGAPLTMFGRFLPADHPHIQITRGHLETVKQEMGEG